VNFKTKLARTNRHAVCDEQRRMSQVLVAAVVVIASVALSIVIARLAVGEMFRLVRFATPRNPPM
jgi:hypothetical protein